ncbi:MAG TPA: hypothetical protein VGJ13_01300 [Pseudonocardiaceae bacterium]|jgi:hypothetical protein
MVLIDLTVVIIALLTVVSTIGLYAIGGPLNHIADNLDDFSQNVREIAGHIQVIKQVVPRLNQTGRLLADEFSLLHDGAERLVAESATPRPLVTDKI